MLSTASTNLHSDGRTAPPDVSAAAKLPSRVSAGPGLASIIPLVLRQEAETPYYDQFMEDFRPVPGKSRREKIRQVFAACRQAVQEELQCQIDNGGDAASATNRRAGKPSEDRPATRNQIRAIESIVKDHALDLAAVLRAYGVEELGGLSLQEASRLIDTLRSTAAVDS